MLEGMSLKEAAACADGHMRAADPSGSASLAPDAFARWAATLVVNKARQALRFKMGLQAEGARGTCMGVEGQRPRGGQRMCEHAQRALMGAGYAALLGRACRAAPAGVPHLRSCIDASAAEHHHLHGAAQLPPGPPPRSPPKRSPHSHTYTHARPCRGPARRVCRVCVLWRA